ncbi:MAG TPA: hypothetical protein PKA90_00495, partial [Ignavibacteria bacterium]|nr:hypothetical protein [Ignavibacteria bacterium]HMR38883.1 hypothetical protein [Ignavibacteria bacterium]
SCSRKEGQYSFVFKFKCSMLKNKSKGSGNDRRKLNNIFKAFSLTFQKQIILFILHYTFIENRKNI